jgi:aspartate aminotransferase
LTLELTAKAAELRAAGKDVVAFAAGEPDFEVPEHVREAAFSAIREGRGKYTAAMGLPELRRLVSRKFREDGFPFGDDQVIVTSGAKHAIYGALYAVCDPGDEVLFPSPYWNSYPDMVRAVEATPVPVPTRLEDGFEPTAAELASRLTPKSRVLVLNSPNNPTGTVYSRRALEGIAGVVRDAGLVVISDDIYEHLIFDGGAYASLLHVAPDLKDQVIVVNGLSKSHCMTGWRCGFAGGPGQIIAAMGRFQSQATSHPSTITQHAAIAALGSGPPVNRAMVAEFERRRDLMYRLLTAIPGIRCPKPRGAFYAFPDMSAFLGPRAPARGFGTAADLAQALLDEALVAVIPGDSFGAPMNLRFSTTCPAATIEKGMDRVRRFLETP